MKTAVLARLAEAVATDDVVAACRRHLGDRACYQENVTDLLVDLLTHASDEVIETVLNMSARRGFLDDHCRIITVFAGRIPQEMLARFVSELETAGRGSGNDECERERALVALACHVSDSHERSRILAAVLDRVEGWQWWDIHRPALIDLIPEATPALRFRAVAAALRQCFDVHHGGDADALVAVLNGDELPMALEQAKRITKNAQRVGAIAAVLRRAGELSVRQPVLDHVDVIGAWPSGATRTELFKLVGASAWWIRSQGGSRAVLATVDALFDVVNWWR
jgi:hypothetical protein